MTIRSQNLLIILAVLALQSCVLNNDNSRETADMIIHSAKITTLDPKFPEVEAIAIKNGRILELGSIEKVTKLKGPKTEVVDAKGNRVVPGLIDSHIHFLRQGNMPGCLVQEIEQVGSVEEFSKLLQVKSKHIHNDEFITVMGGFVLEQLAEKRLPTFEELSKNLPDHPVFVQLGFAGPSVTNAKGKEMLEAAGLAVNDAGTFAKGSETVAAFKAVQGLSMQGTEARNLKNLMAYANSLGLTGIHDEGGTNFPNSSHFDTYTGYDALMSLINEDSVSLRIRIQHVVYDKDSTDGLLEEKLNNTLQGFGNDMVRYWTAGEHIVSFPMDGQVNPNYLDKAMKVAENGWTHEQHSVNFNENQQHIGAIKQVNEVHSIKELRWTLSHVFELGNPNTMHLLEDVKAMNMGLRVQNHGYYTRTDAFPLGRDLGARHSGPLYKTLMKHEVPMGAGTDGPLLGPMNPWYSIYYMVTGKNAAGEVVNHDETISRDKALRMYTLGSAWMSFEEDELGSLEIGKRADLVILNKDLFTVSEEEIKEISSTLTMVNGQIVYSSKYH